MSRASWSSLQAAVRAIDLDEGDWVRTLFAEACALLEEGRGLFVYSYRIDAGSLFRLGSVAGEQTAPAFWRTLVRWGAANQRAFGSIYKTGVGMVDYALSSARTARVALSDPRTGFERHEVADLFAILGHDPAGFGVFLTVPCRRGAPNRLSRHPAAERLAVELAAVARLREHRRRVLAARLSASEAIVARRLLEGASDKEIAFELRVSLSSVSTFVQRIRRKLGCAHGAEVLALSSSMSRAQLERRLTLFDRLTPSECDIASALLVGSSYAEMAARRGVSARTVASQCSAIFSKCGVSGRRALAAVLLAESLPAPGPNEHG
jgi:DNA-binding NarL/FixJ family response regulator